MAGVHGLHDNAGQHLDVQPAPVGIALVEVSDGL